MVITEGKNDVLNSYILENVFLKSEKKNWFISKLFQYVNVLLKMNLRIEEFYFK